MYGLTQNMQHCNLLLTDIYDYTWVYFLYPSLVSLHELASFYSPQCRRRRRITSARPFA